MKSNTHLLGGLAAASLYRMLTEAPSTGEIEIELTYYGAALFGSLLPDLCHPGSILGKKSRILSKTISKTFGHRTITHSWLMLALLIWGIQWIDWTYEESLQRGLIIGVISHIVLDAATTRGIQLFYPLPFRFRFPIFLKTGSKAEIQVASLIGLAAAVMMTDLYIINLL